MVAVGCVLGAVLLLALLRAQSLQNDGAAPVNPSSVLRDAGPKGAKSPARAASPVDDVHPSTPPLAQTIVDYPINLAVLRNQLPDNLYFVLDAPTTDEVELERRRDEKLKWNERFGRVQAGEATVEEVNAYFAQLESVSRDYIEFCEAALALGGDRLPERDRALFEYGITLHRQKLRDIPSQREVALKRQAEQTARQQQWRDENRP
jgi:hypothetical protein